MKVEIWSDVVCPWCAIGKRRFERALSQFDHADEVEVVLRSFELDPTAPRSPRHRPRRAPGGQVRHVPRAGRRQPGPPHRDGRDRRASSSTSTRPSRATPSTPIGCCTWPATAVCRTSWPRACSPPTSATGRPIGEPDVLRAHRGRRPGSTRPRSTRCWPRDAYVAEVRADEDEAQALGVSGVPFFVIDRRYGVSGRPGPRPAARAARQGLGRESAVPNRSAIADRAVPRPPGSRRATGSSWADARVGAVRRGVRSEERGDAAGVGEGGLEAGRCRRRRR